MKISLIHPSRGRPDKSLSAVYKWIIKSGMVDVELVVSIDQNDSSVKRYTSSDYENNIRKHGIEYKIISNDNNSVVEATNRAARESKGGILIYLSDDFDCPDQWGESVIKEFEGVTEPRLIKVDDMLQPFHVPVLTIPIMNRALYERLNYFWYPEYKSMFVDEDLYWTAKKLGALKMCPHLKFEHQHVSVGKAQDDETYRNSAKNWDQGKALFAKRKAAGFPL